MNLELKRLSDLSDRELLRLIEAAATCAALRQGISPREVLKQVVSKAPKVVVPLKQEYSNKIDLALECLDQRAIKLLTLNTGSNGVY